MLNQVQVTTLSMSPALSVVPIVRSASNTRALAVFQSVLDKGTDKGYLAHPEFCRGFQSGYVYEDTMHEFGDDEILLDDVLEFIEENFSPSFVQQQNQQLAFLHMSPMAYEYCVGFALGFLRWLFDAERAPWISLSLLQKWYSIEYLTRSLAVQCVEQEHPQQPVKQTIALGSYWE